MFFLSLFKKKPEPWGWNKKHSICVFTQISIKHQYFLYVFTSKNPLGTQETTLCLPDLPAIALIYTMKTNNSLPESKILFNWRQLGSTELCNMILNSSSCPHCFAYWTTLHTKAQDKRFWEQDFDIKTCIKMHLLCCPVLCFISTAFPISSTAGILRNTTWEKLDRCVNKKCI